MLRIADRFIIGVLWFAVLTFPIFAHAGGLGIAITGTLLGIGGIAAYLFQKRREQRAPLFRSVHAWAAFFLAFLFWANLSALWSPYEADGLTNAHKILLLGLLLLFTPFIFEKTTQEPRPILRRVFMGMSLAAAVIMLLDVASGWRISLFFDPVGAGENLGNRQGDAMMNVGHGLYSYVQYLAPLIVLYCLYLPKFWSRIAAGLLCGALVLGSWLNMLSIGVIGVVMVLGVMASAKFLPRFIISASLIAFAGLILAAPMIGILSEWILTLEDINWSASWDHRLHMWAYSWEQIQTRPWTGHGFDASRTFKDTYPGKLGYDVSLISLHPHNVGLQIWLETGAVGAVLMSAALLTLIKPALAYGQDRYRAAAMSGFIVAVALIGATTIGVWQFWWWGVIAFGVIILSLIAPDKT